MLVFKGFKRSGNHLIIFNIIDNIIEGNQIKSLGTVLHYNHEYKLIYLNCPNSNLNLHKLLIDGNLNECENIIKEFKKQAPKQDTENIKDFLKTPTDDNYKIILSFEDSAIFDDQESIIRYLFNKKEYRKIYITREIKNLYASRKKTGWMKTGKSFLDDYLKYREIIMDEFVINYDSYITSIEYRKNKHQEIGVNRYDLFDPNFKIPIGESSFINKKMDTLNRCDTLDDFDLELLKGIE
jgi:hypothetical protein